MVVLVAVAVAVAAAGETGSFEKWWVSVAAALSKLGCSELLASVVSVSVVDSGRSTRLAGWRALLVRPVAVAE